MLAYYFGPCYVTFVYFALGGDYAKLMPYIKTYPHAKELSWMRMN
jgi:hypothetical protein